MCGGASPTRKMIFTTFLSADQLILFTASSSAWLTASGVSPRTFYRYFGTKEGLFTTDLFAAADLNPQAALITGSVCGVKVQEVEDPLMRRIRYLDKLVDELAKGRPMAKVLRSVPA